MLSHSPKKGKLKVKNRRGCDIIQLVEQFDRAERSVLSTRTMPIIRTMLEIVV